MSHIPAYVYVIFAALLALGLSRCFPRTMRIERLALLPAVVGYLGLRGFAGLFPAANAAALAAGLAGLTLGLAAGWHHAARWSVGIYRAARRIAVPGDIAMLAILMGTFFFEFALHYGHDAHAPWFGALPMAPIAAGVWAVFFGMTAGRNLNLWSRYRAAVTA